MTVLTYAVLQPSERIRRDTKAFFDIVARYRSGGLSEDEFKAAHVPMGIYRQRQKTFMTRVRIGAGMILPSQLLALAEIARSTGPLHITTRQDIQLHDLELDAIPDLLDALLAAGLSTRAGCGNTVRNVTASARAGVDPDEAFDVRPYAIAVAESLLERPESYGLPRKFKVAFSGTPNDEAFATVTDLGFIAVRRGRRKGFRVYAAGGLGARPRLGLLLEDWVSADSVSRIATAVLRFFDQHGDREKRSNARLRFVLDRLGEETFREEYKRHRALVESEGPFVISDALRPFPSPWRRKFAREILAADAANSSNSSNPFDLSKSSNSFVSPLILPERKPGFFTVRINPRNGLVAVEALERIARLAADHAEGLVRATQQQELLLCGVPVTRISTVLDALRVLGTDVFDEGRPSVLACVGAATCLLGICQSHDMAEAIRERFAGGRGARLPPVRISGCPNSCGNHQLAPLGFSGRLRRIDGASAPHYDVLVGGRVGANGQTRLGVKIATLAAEVVPDFLEAAAAVGDFEPHALAALAAQFEATPTTETRTAPVREGVDAP